MKILIKKFRHLSYLWLRNFLLLLLRIVLEFPNFVTLNQIDFNIWTSLVDGYSGYTRNTFMRYVIFAPSHRFDSKWREKGKKKTFTSTAHIKITIFNREFYRWIFMEVVSLIRYIKSRAQGGPFQASWGEFSSYMLICGCLKMQFGKKE